MGKDIPLVVRAGGLALETVGIIGGAYLGYKASQNLFENVPAYLPYISGAVASVGVGKIGKHVGRIGTAATWLAYVAGKVGFDRLRGK